ncbi:MAG: hypothetical protein U5P41_10650 [Gammaproteobacteria bacterium]|nr:hypothetical protein [Gammaproteobacteria bacterium]
MHRQYIITLTALLMLAPPVHADDIQMSSQDPVTKDAAGFGIGALLGGALGGPIGAIAGAAGGAWLGAREEAGDAKREHLAGELAARTAELEQLKSELVALESRDQAANRPVRLDDRSRTAKQLSQALNIAVYFRTDSSELEADAGQRLHRIAAHLREYPRIRIHVADYADRRGQPGVQQASEPAPGRDCRRFTPAGGRRP